MSKYRLKLCFSFMKGNLLLYVGAIITMLVNVALGFVTPMVLGWTIDSFIDSKPLSAPDFIVNFVEMIGGRNYIIRNLWICALAMLLVSMINGLFNFLYAKWSSKASETIAENIRNRLYSHIQVLSYDYHVKAETGDLIQRCTSDVETVRRFLATQLIQVVRSVALVAVALSIMLPLSPKLTLIAVVVVPPIFLFSAVYFKKVLTSFKEADEAEGALSTTLQENLAGMRVVRAFGQQNNEIEKFLYRSNDLRKKFYDLTLINARFWATGDSLANIQRALLLFACIFFVVRGEITIGVMTMFMAYENQLIWPVRQLGRVLADMGKAMVSLERIGEILGAKPETDEKNKLTPPIDGEIVFDDVKFWYEKNKPILNGVSFTAKPGETIAVLGSTGSGKSTMMYLMQRLYDYQEGSVTIGGVELKDIDKEHLRNRVGIVLQEPFLFSKTVRQNIAIVRPSMGDDEVFEAAQTASVHDVIESFEKGYDTMVGERGVTLSGGQKQRVSIARTLLKNNDILIFDDSLSAVDTQTDARIRSALKERRNKATTFIIAHRITTLMQADKILVMEGGKIAQSGSHDELINQDGLYKRIFSIQTALEEELESHGVA
ncbi:MAG: ABC transporter ATP-binding protein [Christensenellales bacterium]